MAGYSLLAPFSIMDDTYRAAFTFYVNDTVGKVETAVAGPLLACVTLWVIVQGILVMRGDIDPRRGLTKLITVALVVGLVTSSSLYQDNVQKLFVEGIPKLVSDLGGNMGLPTVTTPVMLDLIFQLGQAGFNKVASTIPEMDMLDALAFDGSQFFFYFTLWSIFGIYDLVTILTQVLVSLGPLFIIGFLFEATQGITTRWIGQLVSYAILLLLTSIVSTVVVVVIAVSITAIFAAVIGAGTADGTAGTTTGQVIGLFELDLFIMTGNALVVALPAIAASLGGGVAAQGSQLGQSIFRRFAGKPNQSTIQNAGFIS